MTGRRHYSSKIHCPQSNQPTRPTTETRVTAPHTIVIFLCIFRGAALSDRSIQRILHREAGAGEEAGRVALGGHLAWPEAPDWRVLCATTSGAMMRPGPRASLGSGLCFAKISCGLGVPGRLPGLFLTPSTIRAALGASRTKAEQNREASGR